MEKVGGRVPKTLWAYAYEIVPPQAEVQLNAIRTLLEKEHADAGQGARTWTGKLVSEQRVTHLLVVSDSPDQTREVNRRLEGRLTQLRAGFSVTLPMALADEEAPLPEA
jgi:hypothetical protein